jgi:membrane-bound lytic murein transglycosylase B
MTLTRLISAPATARTLLALSLAALALCPPAAWVSTSAYAQSVPQSPLQTPSQTPLQTAPGNVPMGRTPGSTPAIGTLPAGVVKPVVPVPAASAAGVTPAAAPLSASAANATTFEEEIVPQRYADNPAIDSFINEMVARYDFDPAALHALFNQVSYASTAVKLVLPSPTPSLKNWHAYQARFIEPIRINGGLRFWRDNQAALQSVSEQYGVPPEIIVSIIGIETLYGRYMGNFRVLDVLTTLAFDYPDTPNRADRQATFRKNLTDYLVWTRNAGVDPTTLRGSYTGAIGIPQFLPSSIVQYGVSYSGDHPVDLRGNPADAIASVANFLKQQGWETGRPVVWKIAADAGSQGIAQAAADGQATPHWPLSQLLKAGMELDETDIDVPGELSTPLTVIDLPTPGLATEYTLGLTNFYVLTRYNQSFFYANTVYQLAQRLAALMQTQTDAQVQSNPIRSAQAPSTPVQAVPMVLAPPTLPGNWSTPATSPGARNAAPISNTITPPLQSGQ